MIQFVIIYFAVASLEPYYSSKLIECVTNNTLDELASVLIKLAFCSILK